MSFVVAKRIQQEDFPMPMADTDPRGGELRRRCAASGWLSVAGFVFSFLCSRFDRSMDSLFILGIYALAVGVVGCVTYKTRLCLHRAAHRRETRKSNAKLIFLGGGIN
jgi:hypothetical protein